jgi:hypothetical protein
VLSDLPLKIISNWPMPKGPLCENTVGHFMYPLLMIAIAGPIPARPVARHSLFCHLFRPAFNCARSQNSRFLDMHCCKVPAPHIVVDGLNRRALTLKVASSGNRMWIYLMGPDAVNLSYPPCDVATTLRQRSGLVGWSRQAATLERCH